MNHHSWRLQAVFALLTLAALVLGPIALTSHSSSAAPEPTGSIGGPYQGLVQVRNVVAGALNASLSTPTPPPSPTPPTQLNMPVDLKLNLQQSGSQVSGFVMLDRTLLYPRVTTIPATPSGPTPGPGTPRPGATPLDIGPRVTGTYDGTTLTLISEQYTLLLAPAKHLVNGYTLPEQKVTRQFSLVGTVQNDGNTLTGEYRETVWGYGPQPSTAIGSFTLNRPVFINATAAPTQTPGPSPTRTHTPPPGSSPTPTRTVTSQPSLTSTPPPTATRTAGSYHLYLPLVDRRATRP